MCDRTPPNTGRQGPSWLGTRARGEPLSVWPPVVASPPGPPLSASALRPSPAPRRVRLRGRSLPPPGTHSLLGTPPWRRPSLGKTTWIIVEFMPPEPLRVLGEGDSLCLTPSVFSRNLPSMDQFAWRRLSPPSVGSPAPAVGRMGTVHVPVTVTRAHTPDLKPRPGHSHAAWTLSASAVLKLPGWVGRVGRWVARVHGAGLGPFPAP